MKRRNRLLRITTLFTLFALGTSVVCTAIQNKTPTRVEAAQHTSNYASYAYSGSYYNDINFNLSEGMNGALRQAITTLSEPQGFYTYGSQGEDHLATQLQYADADPTNSSNMVYFYTRDSVAKNPATGWNREHVWPQSKSNNNWGEKKGGTDILHLRPTYSSSNSTRGNNPFGEVTNGTPKSVNGMYYGDLGDGYFEPLDSVKGDVARIIMYVWTTYTGYSGYNPLDILDVFQSYNLLLQWHTQDKPDVLEGNRNNYAETSKQKNRNPFVDHPELAWKIFGEKVSSSVKSACQAAYPASGYVPDPDEEIHTTSVSLSPTSLELYPGQTRQLTATILPVDTTDTITWSSTKTSVATVDNNGVVTVLPTATVGTSTTIRVSSGSYSATCVVTVKASSSGSGFELYSDDITEGDYIIRYDGKNMKASISSSRLQYTEDAPTSNVFPAGSDGNIVWHIATSGNYWTLYNETTGKYAASNGTKNQAALVSSVTDNALWTISKSGSAYEIVNKSNAASGVNANLRNNGTYGFACYSTSTGGALSLYKLDESATPIEPTVKEQISDLPTRASLSYEYVKEQSTVLVSDTLDNDLVGNSGTGYSAWTNVTDTSDAVYAGNSAANYNSIQLRTDNNNAGVITTASGGYLAKITVSWNSNTAAGRTINVYGKNSAYSSPADLFGSNAGTLIGTIVKGTSTELTVSGSYQYFGIRSSDKALYLDSIDVDWNVSAASYSYSDIAIRFGGFIDADMWTSLNEESEINKFGLLFSAYTTNLVGLYNTQIANGKTIDQAIAAVTASGEVRNFDKEVSNNSPAEANEAQKIGMYGNDAEKLAKTYLVWSYVRHLDIEDIKTSYSAAAYIRLEDEIVFFDEICITAQGIALKYLTDNIYSDGYLEGSLYNFAIMD